MKCASCGVKIKFPSLCKSCYTRLLNGTRSEPRRPEWYGTMYAEVKV